MNRESEIGVSILCLAFNHEQYIADALEGFLKQKTTFPFEVIIHEDASTDGTAGIIRQYEEKYGDIIFPIYQKENQYSKCVNINDRFMLPRARGKYVALCDGDDFWTDPYKLQKQYDAMEANPECLMCLHKVLDYDTRKQEKQKEKYLPEADLPTGIIKSNVFFEIIGRNDFFNEVCYFFKADAYRKYQSEYPVFAQIYMKNKTDDAPMLYYFAYLANVYYIADNMAVYRRFNEGSWSDRMQGIAQEEETVFFKNAIQAQEAFDEFSGGLFAKELSYSRLYSRFNFARCTKQYKEMLDPEYSVIWNRQSTRYRKRIECLAKYPQFATLGFSVYDWINAAVRKAKRTKR